MSKRKGGKQITFSDLNLNERIALSVVHEALKRNNKHVSVYCKGKTVNVSVYPWEPERTGEWTESEPGFTEPGRGFYECSACRSTQMERSPYCPECGARMEAGT